jgi:quercetin dioxygenase-like cupin family protein
MSDTKPASWNVLGEIIVCRVSGAETGGTHSLFDAIIPAGNGPPLHVHRREDETLYVLEGLIEIHTGGKVLRLRPGDSIYAPRNVAHTFRNPGPSSARMLIMATPAGIEHFFEEIDREIGGSPPDMPRLVAILDRHGIELVRPPPE